MALPTTMRPRTRTPPPLSPAIIAIVALCLLAASVERSAAFNAPSRAVVATGRCRSSTPSFRLDAASFDDSNVDEDSDYEAFDPDADEEPDKLDSLAGKKLGIDIGSYLPSLSQTEIDDIRSAAQETLDAAVDSRLADIERLREQLQDDLKDSRKRMDKAAELNVAMEKQNLMEKIDRISSDFLNKNEDFRESTRRAANADRLAGRTGRGVDWGSWGDTGDGAQVVVIESGDDANIGGIGSNNSGGGRLLGSVDAARRRGRRVAEESELDEDAIVNAPIAENRVLVIADEKKDKGASPILDRLTSLLDDAFDSDIVVDTYSPYASNVPIGGKNAQSVIIFASSLNDRTSLESLLGRILKRTAPVAGGSVGMPPSHVLVVSALGTERTNKMPYSMQNLFGGKLDKLGEIERGIAAISKSRIAGKQSPLDYTVVKFGEVASNDDGVGDGAEVNILPGDALDGTIGPNAAANVLLQALAYQPYARNATLCAAGSLPSNAEIDTPTWNDGFLRLSGPELLRVEAGPGDDESETVLDSKFEQLRQYVKQWSANYEGDRKGTGLTTPVLVRESRRPPSEFDGVVARSGVRILFQTTNTGDRYKSATEERKEENERSTVGGGSAAKKPSPSKGTAKPLPMAKARKEGGVEVLVEKTRDGNVRIRARRCNVDDKTVVKEMSEEVIVRSLKKAVEAWVKARGVTGF